MVLQGTDIRMSEIMKLAHEFLQAFCLNYQPNQNILYGSLDLFLSPGVTHLCLVFVCFNAVSASYHQG